MGAVGAVALSGCGTGLVSVRHQGIALRPRSMSREMISFEFNHLVLLIRRLITVRAVQGFFGERIQRLERDEF